MFTIYIDDLELGTKYSVSKFADDTKMSGRAKCADAESLQKDIDSLSGFPLGALISSHSLRDVLVRYIGRAKFSLSVPEQAPECGDFSQ